MSSLCSDTLTEISSFFTAEELKQIRLVCREWCSACRRDFFFRSVLYIDRIEGVCSLTPKDIVKEPMRIKSGSEILLRSFLLENKIVHTWVYLNSDSVDKSTVGLIRESSMTSLVITRKSPDLVGDDKILILDEGCVCSFFGGEYSVHSRKLPRPIAECGFADPSKRVMCVSYTGSEPLPYYDLPDSWSVECVICVVGHDYEHHIRTASVIRKKFGSKLRLLSVVSRTSINSVLERAVSILDGPTCLVLEKMTTTEKHGALHTACDEEGYTLIRGFKRLVVLRGPPILFDSIMSMCKYGSELEHLVVPDLNYDRLVEAQKRGISLESKLSSFDLRNGYSYRMNSSMYLFIACSILKSGCVPNIGSQNDKKASGFLSDVPIRSELYSSPKNTVRSSVDFLARGCIQTEISKYSLISPSLSYRISKFTSGDIDSHPELDPLRGILSRIIQGRIIRKKR